MKKPLPPLPTEQRVPKPLSKKKQAKVDAMRREREEALLQKKLDELGDRFATPRAGHKERLKKKPPVSQWRRDGL